jgi:hypothetical protein
MPETSVDEHDDPRTREDDVTGTVQARKASAHAKPQTVSVQRRPDG